MHFAEGGEPLAVMTPEVTKDPVVGVDAEELPDDLDGEDFCVRKFGQWTTRPEGSTSESQSVGVGPRPRRRPRSLMRSSMRQKTLTMKVLRSTGRDLLRFDWFGHHRA